MFPVIKGIEIIAGALLLSNRYVPLALAILSPIVFNIVAFHFVLAPPNAVTFLVLFGHAYLLWVYRAAFRGLFVARPKVEQRERVAATRAAHA